MSLLGTNLSVITFEGTSSSAYYDMTSRIKSGNLILNTAIVYTAGDVPHKHLNLSIGNVISNSHVIDNTPGKNFFKVGIKVDVKTIDSVVQNVSYSEPQTGFRMGGDLEKLVKFEIYDENYDLLSSSDLIYYLFQFQIAEPFVI